MRLLNRYKFILLSTSRNIWVNKTIFCFLAVSYALGLLVPTTILAASYQEIMNINRMELNDSNRILRIEFAQSASPTSRQSEDMNHSQSDFYNQMIKLEDEIEDIIYKSEFSSIMFDGIEYHYVNIMQVSKNFIQHFDRFLSSGESDVMLDSTTCVFGNNLYRKINGDWIINSIRIDGKPCTFLGQTDVYKNRVLIGEWNPDDLKGATQFFVKVKPLVSIEAVSSQIQSIRSDATIKRMDIVNREDRNYAYSGFSVVIILSFITLLYALLNIGNIIAMLQRNRSEKQGIQRAIGASKWFIYFEFFLELLITTTLSLIFVIIALILTEPLIERHLFMFDLNIYIVLAVFIVNIIVCLIIGYLYMRNTFNKTIVRLVRESML